jgi:aspartate aminotransferase
VSRISSRIAAIAESQTLAVDAKAKALKAAGEDVVGFGAGEPDFPTPPHIVDRAVEALRKGDTRYTPVGGTPALRSAIAAALERDYGLTYPTAEITASCGAKHTLFNLFMALIDEGDEVIVPSPYWVSYPEQVQVAGGVPVILPATEADGFLVRPEDLARALTPRTKALVLNSPSNPTGAMYDREHLEALARVLRDRDVVVVSDDIYHRLTYDGNRFVSLLEAAPDLRDRTVIVNGVSKTYAMTGWRIGYALGTSDVIAAAGKIQSQSTSNPTSIAQWAALAALRGPQDTVEIMVREFHKRRGVIVDRLNTIPGIHCLKPAGAFYVFPNIAGLIGKSANGKKLSSPCDVADYLLEEAKVAGVPGEDFGSQQHIRFSYATSLPDIEKGCTRIRDAIAKLS